MSKLRDLTGQQFGYLTVIKRVENKGKATRWLCKCKCGNEKIVYGSNLTRGATTSCGCYRKEKLSKDKLQDLSGQKFGRLTVIGLHHYDEKFRHYYWECQCDCGGTTIVYSGHLKTGHTQSCGCLISKGEEKIAQLLSQNNIPFVKQYSFEDCRGVNNGMLRFDFAVFNENGLSHLIEYDGWQHTTKTESKWDRDNRFEERQKHDQIKTEYCKNKNIPLIRISSNQYAKLQIEDLLLKGEQNELSL